MNNKLQIKIYHPDEIRGSEKFKITLNIMNLSDKRIIVKDIREILAPGRISYFDTSSTHLDLDKLSFDRTNLFNEMWAQVIIASKIIIKKQNLIKYYLFKLIKKIDVFLSKFSSNINYNMKFKNEYTELYPNEFFINSFYLTNNEQLKNLKSDYIDKLNDNSEIKKAFYRNEEELNRINENIHNLEKISGRKYGKIIESNQHMKIPIEFSGSYKFKHDQENFVINITYEDESEQLYTASQEININIKPSKTTVFLGALLGVTTTIILTEQIKFIEVINSATPYSFYYDSSLFLSYILAILLSFLTYDDNHKIPIKAEGIWGGFLIGIISVIGKTKLLEVLYTIISK